MKALAVAVIVALLATEAHAQAPDRATELKAREAFAAGRYDEALTLFAKLYAETLHPVYLRNIGRCHQKMREPQKAIDAFKDYLVKWKKLSRDERVEIEGYIKDMEALRDAQAKQSDAQRSPPAVVPTPTPATPPPSSSVTTVANPSPATEPANLLVAQPAPAADQPAIYERWWFWAGVGVVVAGGVAAAILLSGGGVDRPGCDVEACM